MISIKVFTHSHFPTNSKPRGNTLPNHLFGSSRTLKAALSAWCLFGILASSISIAEDAFFPATLSQPGRKQYEQDAQLDTIPNTSVEALEKISDQSELGDGREKHGKHSMQGGQKGHSLYALDPSTKDDIAFSKALQLIWQQLMTGQTEQAEQALRKHIAEEPTDINARYLLSKILRMPEQATSPKTPSSNQKPTASESDPFDSTPKLSRTDEASKELDAILSLSRYIPAFVDRLEIALQYGNIPLATSLEEQLSAFAPNHAMSKYAKGRVQEALGNYDAAYAAYLQSLSARPGNQALHARLARLEVRMDRPHSAWWELSQVQGLDSDNATAWELLADIADKQGHPEQALDFYQRSLSAYTLTQTARLMLAQNRNEDALRMAQAAEVISRSEADLQFQIGLLYIGLSQPQQARRVINRFISLSKANLKPGQTDPVIGQAELLLSTLPPVKPENPTTSSHNKSTAIKKVVAKPIPATRKVTPAATITTTTAPKNTDSAFKPIGLQSSSELAGVEKENQGSPNGNAPLYPATNTLPLEQVDTPVQLNETTADPFQWLEPEREESTHTVAAAPVAGKTASRRPANRRQSSYYYGRYRRPYNQRYNRYYRYNRGGSYYRGSQSYRRGSNTHRP